MQKTVNVELAGGIGNQLFQYYAGLSLALQNEATLRMTFHKNSKAFKLHNSFLGEFCLPYAIDALDHKHTQPAQDFLKRLAQELIQYSPRGFYKYLRYYQASSTGFDPRVSLLKPPIRLSGYFQSYKYYQFVKSFDENLGQLVLRDAGVEFSELTHIVENSRTTSIHIRRGDYVRISQTVGLLSADYYKNALQ